MTSKKPRLIKTPVKAQLHAFGFQKKASGYVYQVPLLDSFDLRVWVFSKGKVSSQIIDVNTGDEYILHRVPNANGTFVGQVRTAYEQKMAELDFCF